MLDRGTPIIVLKSKLLMSQGTGNLNERIFGEGYKIGTTRESQG